MLPRQSLRRAMQKRKLGNPALRSRRWCWAGTCSAGPRTRSVVRACSMRLSAPGSTRSIRRMSIRAGRPGHQGGESETVLGEWMKARGKRDRIVADHQGRQRDAGGQRAQGSLYPERLRGVAEAAPDRSHRSLFLALPGQGDADRGNAGGAPAPDRAGQGARGGRIEL